ncbi:MAG: septation protein SepH [Janthinobacterium lividum]
MQDLRLVGVHDDGEHVVLQGSDGSRYRLRIDEALRAAVRRDRARLGQLQIQMDAQLRPRDIQARIRAGESAEEVAATGGLTLEHVRRYEGPVLDERAHVASLARRTPVGRGSGDGSLDDVVVARLSARAVDPEGARWDSWREEDGAWTVQVEFVAGGRGRIARWGFDPGARSLNAHDDEARWLSEEEAPEPGPLPARRLVSVAGDGTGRTAAERVYDVEADGGVRSADRAARREPPVAADRTEDLLDALDAQRGVRGRLPGPESQAGSQPGSQAGSGSQAGFDDTAAPRVDALTADPPPAHPAASAPHEHEDRTVLPDTTSTRPAAHPPIVGNIDGDRVGDVLDEGAVTSEPLPEDATTDAQVEEAPTPGTPVGDDAGPVVESTTGERVNGESSTGESSTGESGTGESSTGESSTGESATGESTDGDPATSAPRRRNRTGGRRTSGSSPVKRPSVPSWDEIMFGTKKD